MEEMSIAVNLTFLRNGKKPDGVGQFALNLLQGMQETGRLNRDVDLFICASFQKKCRQLFPDAGIIPVTSLPDCNQIKYYYFLKTLFTERCLLPLQLQKGRYDLLYHPYNEAHVHISGSVPTVITLHDLYFKNYPQEFGSRYLRYMEHRYQDLISNTAHIVVPSHYVKGDILKYYAHVNPDKITVIPDPVRIDPAETSPCPVKAPYILSVNSLRSNKNLLTLLKAFQLIEDQIDHHLVLTGAKGGQRSFLEQYAAQNQIKKLILTGYVPDAQRNWLYQNASLFVSPSLHEGFGMTPVEAALFGTPVLTTRETSIPEATRELVNYYEPAADHQAMAEQILHLLANRPPENELLEIKTRLQEAYDPARIAGLYLEAFHSIK